MWCNMSAMHWEARRRQQLLDRRLSDRVKQDEMKGKNKEQSEAQSASAGSESLEVDKKCICKCQPANEETWAKSNKRYSSLQYSQQW
ncbi:coiled-coil domain-containing protein 200-like isoform X1 [Triplophysa dalaica]|uniref:coiled-coil domain-containing protein 200-like isoform X1 n=2 Tax=Triplophysa dalaica TaxID=1582913 RepID=UPI0024DFE7B9|nr:coiled-coil domain-containing protein 200-like isoform X1 [Triplophysa dalaica]